MTILYVERTERNASKYYTGKDRIIPFQGLDVTTLLRVIEHELVDGDTIYFDDLTSKHARTVVSALDNPYIKVVGHWPAVFTPENMGTLDNAFTASKVHENLFETALQAQTLLTAVWGAQSKTVANLDVNVLMKVRYLPTVEAGKKTNRVVLCSEDMWYQNPDYFQSLKNFIFQADPRIDVVVVENPDSVEYREAIKTARAVVIPSQTIEPYTVFGALEAGCTIYSPIDQVASRPDTLIDLYELSNIAQAVRSKEQTKPCFNAVESNLQLTEYLDGLRVLYEAS